MNRNPAILPRAASALFRQALGAMRVVVVMGPRQAGKSTFVRHDPATADRPYLTLDDPDTRLRARADPRAFVSNAPVTIDEVQRVPELVLAVKAAVDAQPTRRTGQYVLTGSAKLLDVPGIADSLAGRAFYLQLWPMTRRELLGLGETGIWGAFFVHPPTDWPDLVRAQTTPETPWQDAVSRGGFPEPALQIEGDAERALWFRGYIGTFLERDLRDLRAVGRIVDVERLMRAAALRLGNLLNVTELSRDTQIPATTVRDYVTLLATSYQVVRLEAYAVNRTKRLIKTPKLYWNDAAVGLRLGGGPPGGAHFENYVLTDLLAWRDSQLEQPEVMYWRTTTGLEVDFVIERGGALLGIEAKATSRPRPQDARGLRAFLEEYPDKAVGGLLLHTGQDVFWMHDRVLAVPWWRVM